jgi:hypothetical protein
MKKIILLFTLFIATFSFAQTANKAIAWSGIITDNSGNVLVNTNVTLKFSITQNGTPIFSEQHNVTTDANGFINATIGEGTPLVNNLSIVYFDTINLKLKIEADSGSGFVTLSDEFFKAVPYAKGSETAREVANDVQYISLNDNIKFYVDGYQGEINQNGLKLADLAGTGSREVIADANGQLQRKPVQTKYLSISGAEFTSPEFGFYPPNYDGLFRYLMDSGNSVKVNAPINLPHNSKIIAVQFMYFDMSISTGFKAGIYSTNSTLNNVPILEFDTDNTDPSYSLQMLNATNLSYTIDNLNNYYYLHLTSDNWQDNVDLIFHKIVITYEE